jgi:hypothetical protein
MTERLQTAMSPASISTCQPVLIIGAPRSGTTLLATMLNAHPRLFVANEAKILLHVLRRVRDPHAPVSRAELAGLLERAGKRELSGYAPLPALEQVLPEDAQPTYANLLNGLFAALARSEHKVRWGEKTAVAYRGLASLASAFPDARFIAVFRDPIDVARSYAKVNPKWGRIGALVHLTEFHRALALHRSAIALHIVDYRQLVTHPDSTLREICAFIGEDYSPQMLAFDTTARARNLSASPVFSGASRPLYNRSSTAADVDPVLKWAMPIYTWHVTRIAAGRTTVPLWEWVVKGLVYARAAVYQHIRSAGGLRRRK